MKPEFTIAVLASGSGSNFAAIQRAAASGKLDVNVGLLVCDRPSAPVVGLAEQAGVPTFAFRPKDYPSREAYEAEIVRRLLACKTDLVVLAGYMRIITEELLRPFEGRIINIHPSLLPAFPGMDAIGQALDHGAKVTGVTVHVVDGGLDSGPIIAQRAVDIREGDTSETLAGRIHAVEHELYPQVIGWLREERVHIEGRHVRIADKATS